MWLSIKRKISSTPRLIRKIENMICFVCVSHVCFVCMSVVCAICLVCCIPCVRHASAMFVPIPQIFVIVSEILCTVIFSVITHFSQRFLMCSYVLFHLFFFMSSHWSFCFIFLGVLFFSSYYDNRLQEASCDKAVYYVATAVLDWQTMPGIRSTLDINSIILICNYQFDQLQNEVVYFNVVDSFNMIVDHTTEMM